MTCRCRLVFGIDHHSFFLRCGIGCRDHTGHVQKTRETRASIYSNLPAPVQDQIAACSAAGIGPHAISRLILDEHNVCVSSKQISRNNKHAELAKNLAGAKRHKKKSEEMSDVDVMTDYS